MGTRPHIQKSASSIEIDGVETEVLSATSRELVDMPHVYELARGRLVNVAGRWYLYRHGKKRLFVQVRI